MYNKIVFVLNFADEPLGIKIDDNKEGTINKGIDKLIYLSRLEA